MITSKKEIGAPQFTVETENWDVESSLPPDTFVFSPPAGANKINFVRVAEVASKHVKQERK